MGTSTISLSNVMAFTTQKSDDGIELTYPGRLPVGTRVTLSINPNAAFVNSNANLMLMAQVLEAPWDVGQWDCWFNNSELTANVYQNINCLITQAGFDTSTANVKISLGVRATTGQVLQISGGTILVNSATLAFPSNANSSAANNSSSAQSLSSSAQTSSVISSAISSGASSSTSSQPAPGAINVGAISISEFITVDQFGYLPDLEKIAVVRDPELGADAHKSFTPSNNYKLVNVTTGLPIADLTPVAWKNGVVSQIAGDKTWWVDFSQVKTPGIFTLVDVNNNVRSPNFKIGDDVYKNVLKQAVRYFYYQRAGTPKTTPYAEAGWTDSASHMGSGQDLQSRAYQVNNSNGIAGTERDLSGGWYDAGDFNKYTQWHANYLIALMHAYLENPDVWTDDFNIPESGNGIPDLIDEIKWGMDWLVKMQNSDGSVLSIQGLSHNKSNGDIASPPSTAAGRSFYGPASTTATLGAAAAFALGAKILPEVDSSYSVYATDLRAGAIKAWDWALANPNVIVHNNDSSKNPAYVGLGAGDQEINTADRAERKVRAAIYLAALTNDSTYHNVVKTNLGNAAYHVDMWNEEYYIMPWLYYASLSTADSATASAIKTRYNDTMNDAGTSKVNFTPIVNKEDAYRAHLGASNFTWGSNRSMSRKGNTFMNLISYKIGDYATVTSQQLKAKNAAVGYLNYLHGSNPLNLVYLSNMGPYGAHNSVDQFYHTWFTHGSSLWDSVNESSYGPPPGFLVGGPNPAYDVDGCCGSNSCGNLNYMCSINLTPPKGQPPMKSYKNMNESWPVNSWQISENHNDYQVAYIRLLSRLTRN